MFSNLSSWFYGSNPTEKTDEAVVNDPCPDSLIEIDENFEQFEPIEIDESDDWVILGKGKLYSDIFKILLQCKNVSNYNMFDTI